MLCQCEKLITICLHNYIYSVLLCSHLEPQIIFLLKSIVVTPSDMQDKFHFTSTYMFPLRHFTLPATTVLCSLNQKKLRERLNFYIRGSWSLFHHTHIQIYSHVICSKQYPNLLSKFYQEEYATVGTLTLYTLPVSNFILLQHSLQELERIFS